LNNIGLVNPALRYPINTYGWS